ncbi:hypothetical protein AB4521_11875 [Vibrio cyclitrophicus]
MTPKITKVAATICEVINEPIKDKANFANHLIYNITNKKTGLICPDRCDLFMNLNPQFKAFGAFLKIEGHKLDKKQVRIVCFEEARKQKSHFLKYVMNSPNRKFLDENGECFDVKKLWHYKTSFNFQMHEYQNILKDFDSDEYKTKMKMQEIKNRFICVLYNRKKLQIKKSQNKDKTKTVKLTKAETTTIEDIESVDNFHIKGEANPHIHSYLHSFDPKTGALMNISAKDKQEAHKVIEKMYKQYLDQGIAVGFDKVEGLANRRIYLEQLLESGIGQRRTIDTYNALQQRVKTAFELGMKSPERLNEILAEHNVELIRAKATKKEYGNGEKAIINLRFPETTAIFNIESFRDKSVRRLLQSHALRTEHNQRSRVKIHEVEEVIQLRYSIMQESLNKDLVLLPVDKHAERKKEAFEQFAQGLKESGIILDINAKGAASYLVMSNNTFKSLENVTLEPVKSSLMVNTELHGKNLAEYFSIDEQMALNHKIQYMTDVPKSVRYGKKKVHMIGDTSEVNFVNYELLIMRLTKDYLKKLDAHKVDTENGFVLFKGNKPLLKFEKIDDERAVITTSGLYPNQAAKLLHDVLIEDCNTLKKNEIIVVTPKSGNIETDLRHLQVKLLFSTNKKSKKIKVDYPNKDNDPELKKLIQKELDYKFSTMDESLNKNVKKIKNNFYNFTEANGIAILNNPEMKEYKDQISQKLNEQIITLVAKHDVEEIKFNHVFQEEYFSENKNQLLEMAESLPPEEKAKVIQFVNRYEEDTKTGSGSTKQTNTVKNKSKNRNGKGKLRR